MKTKVKIKTFSSIVIEGIKTLFFSEIKKKNKQTNTQIQLLTNLKRNLAH